MARDYYRALGVDSKASDQEIKRAYRKLARELHPDVNPDAAAQDRFREVTDAYEVLSDPEKRRIVDLGGDPLEGPSQGGGFGGFGNAQGFSGGLGDVFEAFFGGAGGGASRGPRGRVRPGADSNVGVTLTLEECAAGVSKDLTIDTAVLCDVCHGSGANGSSQAHTCATCKGAGEVQSVQRSFLGQVMTSRRCPTCDGAGEVIDDPCRKCGGDGRERSRRTLTVKVPAGVGNGMKVRLVGQGEVGAGGGPAGDLYVQIAEKVDDVLVRDGDDLHVSVTVPMFDAVLGTSVVVSTVLGSHVDVAIKAGTQSGEVERIRGHGMPQLNSGPRGDLYVHLDVLVPNRLDRKQTEKLQELKELFPTAQAVVTRKGGNGHHKDNVFSRLRNTFAGR